MGVLTIDERGQLIDLLSQVPNIDDPAARRLLIANLPRGLQENIPFSNTEAIHVSNIVDAINSDAWTYLPDGTLAAATVITSAIQMVEGSALAEQLTALRNTLQARPVPPPPPAPGGPGSQLPAPAAARTTPPPSGGLAPASLMANIVQQGGTILGWVGLGLGVIAFVVSGDLKTAIPVGFALLTFWLLTAANRNPLYLRVFAAIVCVIDLFIAGTFAAYGTLSTFLVALTALDFLAAAILLTIKYTQNKPLS